MSFLLTVQVGTAERPAAMPDDAQLQQALDATISAVSASHAVPGQPREVALRVVDADEIQSLNATWRGKDRPTNVLAFPVDPDLALPAQGLAPAGDLVICAEVVEREAQEQGKSIADHWAHLLMHGALHLMNFDHIGEADAAEMEEIECRALALLGIANPYR
ncbi:MAG: rRNA maturation RNase YbeY [Pseudomonadota bacterium]